MWSQEEKELDPSQCHREGKHPVDQSMLNSTTPQLVKQCNEGAHKMERTEQMYTLHMQLDFGKVKVGAVPTPHLTLLSDLGIAG